MAAYTLSNCLLDDVEIDKRHVADLLMVFPQQNNPYKVALDHSNRIIEIYERSAKNSEIIATWLNLMTMKPSSFEKIKIETGNLDNDEEIFLKVCSATVDQQKLIVNTHQNWRTFIYTSKNTFVYNEKTITVYDKDEAVIELNIQQSININAVGSVIALQNSAIENIKNKNKWNKISKIQLWRKTKLQYQKLKIAVRKILIR